MDIKDKDYTSWISEIKQRYKNAQIKASIRVNEELLRFYYRLGEEIAKSGYEAKYGASFYNRLSKDLRSEIPDAGGFSARNLHYMRWFYERYSPLFRFSQQLSKSEVVRTNRSHLEHGKIDSIDKLFFKKSNQIRSSAKMSENIDCTIRNENRQQVADDLAVDNSIYGNNSCENESIQFSKNIDIALETRILQQLAVKLATDKSESIISSCAESLFGKANGNREKQQNVAYFDASSYINVIGFLISSQEITHSKRLDSSVSTAKNENILRVVANLLISKTEQMLKTLDSVPWGHHMIILSKCRSLEESLFYLKQIYENNWSRAVLLNFIKSDLFSRQGKAISNFASALPKQESDLAQALTRDPYVINFLTIDKRYKEKNLKDALIDNVENFLLELGNGFAFLGKEKRIEVGEKEKFLDMLFYNMNLHCYVVVEIKVEEFDSDNLGQIGLYVSEVDRQFRKVGDNPTIGLLIVASKDELFAKYALIMVSVPVGIAEYKLTNLLPDELKDDLPSIEEIEKGIR